MKTYRSFLLLPVFCIVFTIAYLTVSAQSRPQQRPHLSTRSYAGKDTTVRTGVLTFFPTNFVASTMKIGYEFRLTQNKGLKLLGSYGSSANQSNASSGNDYYSLNSFSEFGLEAQLRFYVLKGRPSLNGLYMAPYLLYKSMNYTYSSQNPITFLPENASGTTSDFSIGYVIGYQILYNSSFSLDMFVGGGINSISGDNTHGNLGTDIFGYYKGIMIHPGIGIGIAF